MHFLVLLIVPILLVSCSAESQELSRERAAGLLRTKIERTFAVATMILNDREPSRSPVHARLESMGFLEKRCPSTCDFSVTAAGAEFLYAWHHEGKNDENLTFATAQGYCLPHDKTCIGVDWVVARLKLGSVTGITGTMMPNVKLVVYMYDLEPTPLAPAFGLPGSKSSAEGRAIFKRYDDGWRMESLMLK